MPFLREVAGTWTIVTGLAAASGALSAARSSRRDRDTIKAAAARAAFRDRRVDAVDRRSPSDSPPIVHRDWIRGRRPRPICAPTVDAGDAIVIVSASFEMYVQPLGALLGVDDVLATRLAVDGGESLTGALDGPNCRGPEKVRRLHAWLDTSTTADERRSSVVAYGDSPGDRELLADADGAHWVEAR